MRTLRVLVGTVALVAMTGGTAHADSVQVSGDCGTVTVTAPAGSRAIVGMDASPPYEVDDGNTRTFKFFQAADHHVWAVTILVDNATVDHVEGGVDGCAPQAPIAESRATEPVAVTAVEPIVGPVPEPTPPATPWADVALAPPW